MDERVKRLKTPKECEIFIERAKERGSDELVAQAVQRAVELRALAYGAGSEVERECIEAIHAFEEVKTAEKQRSSPGKKKIRRYRANRTWGMVKEHGILKAAERAVNRKDATTGFRALQEAGLTRFAFEAVVLRYPESFSPAAVDKSRERMENL
jgi:hypothetical protein